MKFLYSDTQDYVDPEYDFLRDENKPGRRRYWDDRYAHELMAETPYDGLLVSMSGIRAVPGASASKGRYTMAEEQRLLRVGVRRFLRFDGERHRDKMVMGDCGAFAYADQPKPAYTPEEVVEFYADAGFTHGCHPDHIIFDFHLDNPSLAEAEQRALDRHAARQGKQKQLALIEDFDEEAVQLPLQLPVGATIGERYELTLANAKEFLRLTKIEGEPFEPIGVIQGWSPESLADAAVSLEAMGYRYLAVGGLVPLKTPDIHKALEYIRLAIRAETKLHLLGFAKADQIADFKRYGVASFDSTSPLIRAFKDATRNYYTPRADGRLDYFAAIRIPQAIENSRLMGAIKSGLLDPNALQRREARALAAVRGFDKRQVSRQTALQEIGEYQHDLFLASEPDAGKRERMEKKSLAMLERTLDAAPWKHCKCSICKAVGVEVIIFRSANRNRRRGFHNLGVYREHVRNLVGA